MRKRKGKFAMLRDAFKASRAHWQTIRTPETRAVYDYMQNVRAASVLLSKLRQTAALQTNNFYEPED